MTRALALPVVGLLAALWLAAPVAGQDLGGALGIAIEPEQITVGGTARAVLTLVWEGDTPSGTPQFPAWPNDAPWGEAEVLGAGPVETKSDSARRVYTQTLTLTAFRPGTLELPPLTVKVPLAGRVAEVKNTGAVRLLVASVLPGEKSAEGQELEAKGAAGLVGLRLSPWPFWIALGLLVAANGGAALRVATMAARQREPAGPAAASAFAHLSPFEELVERLDALDPAEPEPAHTGISFALRQFLGRTFEVHALESTTTEIQRLLRSVLPVALAHELVGLLRDCDRVKFAGGLGAASESAGAAERLLRARSLGQQVVERLRPASDKVTPALPVSGPKSERAAKERRA